MNKDKNMMQQTETKYLNCFIHSLNLRDLNEVSTHTLVDLVYYVKLQMQL